MARPRKISNIYDAPKSDVQFIEGQKSKGILDDHAVRGSLETKEITTSSIKAPGSEDIIIYDDLYLNNSYVNIKCPGDIKLFPNYTVGDVTGFLCRKIDVGGVDRILFDAFGCDSFYFYDDVKTGPGVDLDITGTITCQTIDPTLQQDNIDLNDNRVTGLEDPLNNQDAATKKYVDDNIGLETGVIVMWAGTIANIPSGYYLCDGTNGTPDLTHTFIRGVGGSCDDPGDTGGSETHTHGITGTSNSSLTTHYHGISLTSGTVASCYSGYSETCGCYEGYATHTHNVTGNTATANLAHTHTNSFTSATCSTLPTYYELAFIQKAA